MAPASAPSEPASPSRPPPQQIDIADQDYEVVGMDFIIHNMYADRGFGTFRKWFNDDVDAMLRRVASHVEQGLYNVTSIQLSRHSCVVICLSEMAIADFPGESMDG